MKHFILLIGLIVFGILIYIFLPSSIEDKVDTDKSIKTNKLTPIFTRQDLKNMMRLGLDIDHPKYQIKKNKADYDFQLLKTVENKYQQVDRQQQLQYIFQEITVDSKNETEKHLAVLEFLQKIFFQKKRQPRTPDGKRVLDPLVLLVLGEAKTGQIARVAVDLWLANGYKARLVSLKHHTVAEIYYEDAWHYLDASLFGKNIVIKDKAIPSVANLKFVYILRNPYAQFNSSINSKRLGTN